MIGLAWNCRGINNPRAVRVVCEMVRSHRVDILFLIETISHAKKIEEIRRKLGFEGAFAVDREGPGGGLAALWRKNSLCSVVGFSLNFINLRIEDGVHPKWRFTCFYGFPERSRRRDSWELLRSLAGRSNLPWCIIGDFNDLLRLEDKVGGSEHPEGLFRGFGNAISDCALHEIALLGSQYTWERGRGTDRWVKERLDRAFGTDGWMNQFPNAKLHNLIAPV